MSVIIKVISVSQDFMDQICELLYFGDLVRAWLAEFIMGQICT